MAKLSRLFFAQRSRPTEILRPGGSLIAGLKAGVPAAEDGSGGGLARLLARTATATAARATATAHLPVGRLAFVIDATASRAAAWNEAKKIQRRMVQNTRRFGCLALRVVHFGGGAGGPGASVQSYPAAWTERPEEITKHMDGISCVRGNTQILAAMRLVLSFKPGATAVVAIGDSCEESLASLHEAGREFGRRRIPVFAFLDGDDPGGEAAYRALAKESGGAFAPFGAKLDLSSLIVAAAAYATGGAPALLMLAGETGQDHAAALELAHQLRLPPPRR
jgi:hypothetical protein